MEKEKILDKMRELRDVRDLQILSKELENINLDVDYKKDLAENKVLDVKFTKILTLMVKKKKD